MRNIKCLVAGLAMMALTVGARAADIQPFYKSGFFVSSLGVVFNGSSKTTAAGTFNVTMTGGPVNYPASFEAYCVDLAHALTGLPYTVNLLPETSLTNGQRVAWLYQHFGTAAFGTKVVDANSAAGLQAAMWDVVYDGGDGFANGNFRLQTLSGSVYTNGNAYLTSSIGKSDTATYLQAVDHTNNKNQDMIGPTAVPEPGAIAFMGSGAIGLLGLLIRRRKR
jgi:hypothetical protein